MTTTIYTKTSQVTVGQLHCFEMIPLGTFSTFDAPDLCTLHVVTAGNRFPSKALNFKLLHSGPSNTFIKRRLRRRRQSAFFLGRNLLSILPSFDRHFDRLNQSKTSFSFNGWHQQNKGVEFRSQQISPQECLISTLKEKGILWNAIRHLSFHA